MYSTAIIDALKSPLKLLINEYIDDINSDQLDVELSEEFVNETTEAALQKLFNTDTDEYFTASFFTNNNGPLIFFIENQIEDLVLDRYWEYTEDLKHRDDVLELDRETGTMKFNNDSVPAYWYNPEMSEDEIAGHLKEYRKIWSGLGYGEVRYPVLESFGKLFELEEYGVSETLLKKMERDLECLDTDEAQRLFQMMVSDKSPFDILEEYPDKLKDVLVYRYLGTKPESFYHGYEFYLIDLILKDGGSVQVEVGVIGNNVRSVSAVGAKGFPILTPGDEELIIKRIKKDA